MKVSPQRFHFIAIGGSVMHNLAIALHQAGHIITGSDDEIFEPSRSSLANQKLLPEEGWFPERITHDLDCVILGMHARADNPELLRAQQLGLTILSFPDFIYNQAKEKKRIVIAGSHGKTTITSMIAHVLNFHKRNFDYVIGARVKGLELTVKLSDAPIIIIEGDEYLSAAIDPTPKFLRYQHHIGVISGIAWDHANVFPTEADYQVQFEKFVANTPDGGTLVYCQHDANVVSLCQHVREAIKRIPYTTHPHIIEHGKIYLTTTNKKIPIKVFGQHNLQNIQAAYEVTKQIGISDEEFYVAIPSFEGASGRLESVHETSSSLILKDFAHSPSKVKATVKAVKDLHPDRKLVAVLELHTFSSLNKKFLPQYNQSLDEADNAIVFFDPEKVKQKKLEPIAEKEVQAAFGAKALCVFTNKLHLESYLREQDWKNKNLLMMSSGNFNNLDLRTLAATL